MRFDFIFDRFLAKLESPRQLSEALERLDRRLPASLSVVGNAASLLEARHGADIDARPTIRFNHAQIVDGDAQGRRWDFVATSMAHVLRYYQDNEPQYEALIYTAHIDQNLRNLRAIGSKRPVLDYPLRLSRELLLTLRARPTTGLQVLHLLDRLGRKDVHVYGFDWKTTQTFYHTSPGKDPHNYIGERRMALALIEKNGWRLAT